MAFVLKGFLLGTTYDRSQASSAVGWGSQAGWGVFTWGKGGWPKATQVSPLLT